MTGIIISLLIIICYLLFFRLCQISDELTRDNLKIEILMGEKELLKFSLRRVIAAIKDRDPNRAEGLAQQATIKAKVAEKLAERSFSLASSAVVTLGMIQRTLNVRPKTDKKTKLQDAAIWRELTSQYGSEADFMFAALNDEERKIVMNARLATSPDNLENDN